MRFDQRKNYERKKYGLCVKMPSDIQKTTELVVRLPFSAYTSAEVSDVSVLYDRIKQSDKLPSGWILLEQPVGVTYPSLVLCKVQVCASLCAASTTFTLTLDRQCCWCLKLEASELSHENCQFLAGVDVKLSSVDALVKFLSDLDESTFCVGNADSKFLHLIERHKGVFKDHSGESVEYF